MPQDGANNYQYPPGTPGIPDTTIESEAYNTFLDDLVINDLNIPRPLHRGGTGSTNALDARNALGAEVSSINQQVTNYDSQVFQSGSFLSLTGATGAPVAGESFTGVCALLTADGTSLTLRAISATTGVSWDRRKNAGVWGAWTRTDQAATDLANTKVAQAGDTMTGPLTISYTAAPTTGYTIYGNAGKYFGFDGTNFVSNGPLAVGGPVSGSQLITPGTVSGAQIISNGAVFTGFGGAIGGTYYFGNNATRYLTHNGASDFSLVGGNLNTSNSIISGGEISTASNVLRFGSAASTSYLGFDGTNYILTPGHLSAGGFNATGQSTLGSTIINIVAGSIEQSIPGSLEIIGAGGGNNAFMSLHRPGVVAMNFGLGGDGHLRIGGWSLGVTSYRVWTEQDFPAPALFEKKVLDMLDAITARLEKLEQQPSK